MRARVFLALLALTILACPALAQGRYGGHGDSLDRVLPQIRRTMPGTFYDAQGPFYSPDGRASYRIKWMTPDGRIVWFYADARTGRVLRMGGAQPYGGRSGRYQNRDYQDRYPGRDRDDRRNNWRGGDNWGGSHDGWGARRDGRSGGHSSGRMDRRGGDRGHGGWGGGGHGDRGGGDHRGRGGRHGG